MKDKKETFILKCATQIENLLVTIFFHTAPDTNEVTVNPNHTHSYSELFFCTHGALSICTTTSHFTLNPGEMIIMPPLIQHRSLPQGEDDSYVAIGLVAERYPNGGTRNLYEELNPILTNGQIRLCKNAGLLLSIITEILSAPKETRSAYLTTQFLYHLLSMPWEIAEDYAFPRTTDMSTKDQERIIYFETLINSYFDQDLTIPKIASLMYMSTRQLARIVQKHYGVSIRKLIMNKRMEAAAKLLISTNDSSERIGEQVGFKAKSSFYREFCAYYGMTPSEYRRANKL